MLGKPEENDLHKNLESKIKDKSRSLSPVDLGPRALSEQPSPSEPGTESEDEDERMKGMEYSIHWDEKSGFPETPVD